MVNYPESGQFTQNGILTPSPLSCPVLVKESVILSDKAGL